MNLILCLLAAIPLLLCGCVTPPAAPPQPTVKIIGAPYAQVWAATVKAVSLQNYPMQVVQKDSGVIQTESFNPGPLSPYATAPGVLFGLWSDSKARLSILVSSNDATSTLVRVNAHFEGFEYNDTKSWYEWTSNGQLENNLIAQIEAFATQQQ